MASHGNNEHVHSLQATVYPLLLHKPQSSSHLRDRLPVSRLRRMRLKTACTPCAFWEWLPSAPAPVWLPRLPPELMEERGAEVWDRSKGSGATGLEGVPVEERLNWTTVIVAYSRRRAAISQYSQIRSSSLERYTPGGARGRFTSSLRGGGDKMLDAIHTGRWLQP